MSKALFEEFEKQKPEEWTNLLQKDLRGESIESLLWKTQGVNGKPFYTSEDIDFEPFNYAQFSKDATIFGDRFWVNYQPIKVIDQKSANTKALHALENGANGILFELEFTPDWIVLLKDIQPQYCHLSFQLNTVIDSKEFFYSYLNFLTDQNIDSKQATGFVKGLTDQLNSSIQLKTNLFEIPQLNHAALELAISFASLIDKIDANTTTKKEVEYILQSTAFQLTLTNDFFLEIAKSRATRRIFEAIVSGYGLKGISTEIISQIGPWETTIDDPHSFMLYATTQTFAAIIGGTDAVIVQPFHNIFPNKPALAERMARNISSILREESYLDKMVDPSAGSYYIERLTEDIFNQTIIFLKEVENKGGLSKIDIESFTTKSTSQ